MIKDRTRGSAINPHTGGGCAWRILNRASLSGGNNLRETRKKERGGQTAFFQFENVVCLFFLYSKA
jgi:hypothetical protein